VSHSVAAAKARYLQCQHEAFRSCERDLAKSIGYFFTLSEISQRALLAVQTHWEPSGRPAETSWDWKRVLQRYRNELDRFELAIWEGDRLCALGLATTGGNAVALRFLEGDPRGDCPLKGRRILIALDACARYAQRRGKAELRVQPINSALESLYVGTYGFRKRSPKGEQPYFCRQV